ncbi:copper transport protein CCH [Cryptomeria japonica]|uniref:copper transport protein CCH n=1 Tax=Cryptomeria japonica TaxID=3369 RepID=UPI0025AB9DBE|nr:copper transport protein CCH [Cryptomeria japonica]
MVFFSQGATQMPPTAQLRSAEALTMPGVQVIVLNANMRCQECRAKVSKVLSKMDNLLDYCVDVTQKKVTVRGSVDPKKRMRRLLNQKREKNVKFERLNAERDLEDPKRKKGNFFSHNFLKGACCFH